MAETEFQFCEVALPVPVDRVFTYELPFTLRHRVKAGCRVTAPFGSRQLTGVVVRTHNSPPENSIREILGLRDEEPVLDPDLIQLGQWIAEYYCAPIGEVMKGMLPLSGEIRRSTIYSLTDAGRDVARQLIIRPDSDPSFQILAALAERERPLESLKIGNAKNLARSLIKRGWVVAQDKEAERDPLRAPSERLSAEFRTRPAEGIKLKKAERELIAFLELHPGAHNLALLAKSVKNASEAARSLARSELIKLAVEGPTAPAGFNRPIPQLNAHQQAAFEAIRTALGRPDFKAFLLQGVTGSGKTEVYLSSIEAALAAGRNALLLVPEIALTPAMAGQFFHRFGKQVAILHSAFGDSERADQWRRIRNGQARVVVGTRSGVFAPVQNLGLVIVDEEHDGSYKQPETPRYHGRDVAIVRARNANAIIVLGSATPSIETRYNADQGRYAMLSLPERIAKRPMPKVQVVDMRAEFLETKHQTTFSRALLEEMQARLKNGEQTMLLLNRRGLLQLYGLPRMRREDALRKIARLFLRCIGATAACCATCVVLPKKFPASAPSAPAIKSNSWALVRNGWKTNSINICRAHVSPVSTATAPAPREHSKTSLARFRDGDIDLLVGTQMIAKGHDIPNVTLVGVVLADIGLSIPDFRAAERTFQLLTQAAGRAGRGTTPGHVVIQTLNPDHYAIRFAADQDYEGFFRKEMEFRKYLRYPPFAACANIIVRAEKQEEALRLSSELGFLLTPQPPGIRVMGPAEAAVLRVRNEFRYQIFLKAARRTILRETIQAIRAHAEKEKWRSNALVIDIDPMQLM